MNKRHCGVGRGTSPWPNFLPDHLRPFVHGQDRAQLAAVCRAFRKPFRTAEALWHSADSLFGNYDHDEDPEISAYLEDVDKIFADIDVDWLVERERWEKIMLMIRVLSFIPRNHSPPPFWDVMPVLDNLSNLTVIGQTWFPGPDCAEKMPNLTWLDLAVCLRIAELDLTAFAKLRRLVLRTEKSVADTIDIDLPVGCHDVSVDANFVIRSGSETIDELTLMAHQVVIKFVLEAPRWPALTSLNVTSGMIELDLPSGVLQLRQFDFPSDFAYSEEFQLQKVCDVGRLRSLLFEPDGSSSVLTTFPRHGLASLEELDLVSPGSKSYDLEPLVAVRDTLKRLSIWSGQTKSHLDMKNVGRLTRLESLSLDTSTNYLAHATLSYLRSCQELRHLSVRGLLLDKPETRFSLPKLETLNLAVREIDSFCDVTRMLSGLPNSLRRLTFGCVAVGPADNVTKLFKTFRRFKRLEWLDLNGIRGSQRKYFVPSPTRDIELDNWLSPDCAILPCEDDRFY